MKPCYLVSLLFSLFPFFSYANIWDNLFLGQGIAFRLPTNFSMELSMKQTIGKIKFKVVGSSDLNSVSASQALSLGGIFSSLSSDLLDYRFNFTNATLFLHSPLKECISIQDERFEGDFYHLIQGYIDLGTLLVSKVKEGDYYRLNIKDLIQITKVSDKIPDLIFFFDSTTENLKKIEITLPDSQHFDLDVISLKPYNPSLEEFLPSDSWNCDKEKMKTLDEIDPEELLDEVKKSKSPLLGLLKFLPFDVSSLTNLLGKS